MPHGTYWTDCPIGRRLAHVAVTREQHMSQTWQSILQYLGDGMLAWRPWQIVAYTAATTHLTIVAVTVYLHRCQAHRALELHPAVSHVFRFWLWIATGMATREWVAVHRKHHACCEREGDPHSPQLFGIARVLLQGTELYRDQARDAAVVARYGHGTPDDWLERHVYGVLSWQGVGLLLVVDVALFGVIGLTVWGVQMLWIPVTAAGIVNGIGHYLGYRSFDGPTAAANIVPWGIVIGGEELHGNHHAFPTSARLSVRWFEVDIGWAYIRILAWAGLARVRHLAPRPPARRAPAAALCAATLDGIIACREHVLRAHGQMAVRVFRAELRRARARIGLRARRRAERLLRRDPEYMSAEQRSALAALVDRHGALAPALRMRAELRQLWEEREVDAGEALARLGGLCERAERAGVPALRAFAARLRAYAGAAAQRTRHQFDGPSSGASRGM
jgi:stearoyl-CoA desaturase (delta-9 desaturase)